MRKNKSIVACLIEQGTLEKNHNLKKLLLQFKQRNLLKIC